MKTKEDAAKVLLENGFTLTEVNEVLKKEIVYVPSYPSYPPYWVWPYNRPYQPYRITWGDVTTNGTGNYTTDKVQVYSMPSNITFTGEN